MNTTRRTFIKGLAAFAALAVAPAIPAALVETEHQRLFRLMRTGLIEGETFYLDHGILLRDVHNLIVRNCNFIFTEDISDGPALEIGSGCSDICFDCISWDFSRLHPNGDQFIVYDLANNSERSNWE